MIARGLFTIFLAGSLGLVSAAHASAQPLGTFRWQLHPYCNVVTLAVTQVGPTQYRFEGLDDLCGAATRAAVTGLAVANLDGTLEFGWTIVSAAGPQHVDVTFSIAPLGGPWRDNGGNTGTLIFNPGAVSGPPRPGGLGAIAINPAQVQARINGACGAGQYVQAVNADGTVTCGSDASGAGTITAVTAGTGLTGGGTSGAVALAVDPGVIQNRVTGSCGAGLYVQTVAADGSVSCGATPLAGPGAAATAARSDHTHTDATTRSTAIGPGALAANVTGNEHIAIGAEALEAMTAGSRSVAIGFRALESAVFDPNVFLSGLPNIAIGANAMRSTTTGTLNVAVGTGTLANNTLGISNIAIGNATMLGNSIGSDNTAVGHQSLLANQTGSAQTALGASALGAVSAGDGNTAVGARTLPFLADGSFNIAIGYSAGASLLKAGDHNILIGSEGVDGDSNTIRIGAGQTAAYIAGILSNPLGAMPVMIDKNGRLGFNASSRRFKEQIEPLDGSGVVQALRPVSFFYKPEFDAGPRVKQYGLIAEEVDAIDPNLVVRDGNGAILTVRYQALPPLLLAEVQRLERERTAMRRTYDAALDALREEVAALRASIEKR